MSDINHWPLRAGALYVACIAVAATVAYVALAVAGRSGAAVYAQPAGWVVLSGVAAAYVAGFAMLIRSTRRTNGKEASDLLSGAMLVCALGFAVLISYPAMMDVLAG